MTGAPVPLVLDLWATGLSARVISEMLDVPRRTVHMIVEQARDIGDHRAVLHAGKNGRGIGRPNKGIDPADVEMVPAITAPVCRRGHPRIPENVDNSSNCRICDRARKRADYEARRA